jgi:hypothetical protein
MVPLGAITASDFTGSTRFELSNDSGTFNLTANADNYTEGEEKFKVAFYVKDGKLDPFYTSPPISILDTSATPPPVLSILPSALPNGRVGVAYTQELTVVGGDGNHIVEQTSGTLPTGLKLEKIGSKYTITGTPTVPNTYNFTLTATGVVDFGIGSASLTIIVNGAGLIISPTLLPPGKVSEAYTQQLTASGGNGNYTFSLLSGSLPTGINFLTAGGIISGTPTSSGSYPIVIKVVDTNGGSGEQSYNLVIAAPISLLIHPEQLNIAKVGTEYQQGVEMVSPGTVAPLTWTFTTLSGSTTGVFPTGISVGPMGGIVGSNRYLISGTPATGSMAKYPIVVTVKDGANNSGTKTYDLIVTDRDASVITIANATELYYAVHNIEYNEQLISTGITGGTVTYSLDGSLPPGLKLSSSGRISGVPNLPDSYKLYRFTVVITDAQRGSGSKLFTMPAVKYSITPGSTAVSAGKSVLLDVEGADIEGVTLQVVNPNTETLATGAGVPKFSSSGGTSVVVQNKDKKLLDDQVVNFGEMALSTKKKLVTITAKASHFNEFTSNPLLENTYISITIDTVTTKINHTYGRGHTIATINEKTAVCERIVTIDTWGGGTKLIPEVNLPGWCKTTYAEPAGSAQSFDTMTIKSQEIDSVGNFSFSENWVTPGYSIQWTGFFLAAHGAGRYYFDSSVDDLLAVWIGDQAVSGYTWENATFISRLKQPAGASIELLANKLYPIRIQFVQVGGPGNYSLGWAPPSNPSAFSTNFSSVMVNRGRCNGTSRPILTDMYHDAYSAFKDFITEIDNVPEGRIIAVTSFDAIQITKPMRALLASFGGLSPSKDTIIETQDVSQSRIRHTFIGKKIGTSAAIKEKLSTTLTPFTAYTLEIEGPDTVNVPSNSVQFIAFGPYKSNNKTIFTRSTTVTVSPSSLPSTLQVAGPTIITSLSALTVNILSEPGDTVSWEYIPPGQWYLDNIYFDYYPDVAAAWERDSQGKTKTDYANTHYTNWGRVENRKSPTELLSIVGVGSNTVLTESSKSVSFSGQPILPRKTPYKWMFTSAKTKTTDTIEVKFYSGKLVVTLDPDRFSIVSGEQIKVSIQGAGLEQVTVSSGNGLPGAVLNLDSNGSGFCVLVPTGSTVVTLGTYTWTFTGTVSAFTSFSVTVAGANYSVFVPDEIICNKAGIITRSNTADRLSGAPNRKYDIYNAVNVYTGQSVTTPASGIATGFIVKYGEVAQAAVYQRIIKDSTDTTRSVTVNYRITHYNEFVTAGYVTSMTTQHQSGAYLFNKNETFKFVITGTAPGETVQRSFTIYDNSGKQISFGESAPKSKTGEYFFDDEKIPSTSPDQGRVLFTFKFTKSENIVEYEYKYGTPAPFTVTATATPRFTVVTAQGSVNAYNPTEPIFWTVTGNPGDDISVEAPVYTTVEKINDTDYTMFTVAEGTWTHTRHIGYVTKRSKISNSGSITIDVHGGENGFPVLTQYQKDYYSPIGAGVTKTARLTVIDRPPNVDGSYPSGSIVVYSDRKLETAYKYKFTFKNTTTGATAVKEFWVLAYKYLNTIPGATFNETSNDVHVLDLSTNTMNEGTSQNATYSLNQPPGISSFTIESSDTAAITVSTGTLIVNSIPDAQMYRSSPVTLTSQIVNADKNVYITVKRDGRIVVRQTIIVKNNTAGIPNVLAESDPIIRFGHLDINGSLFPAFEVTSAATKVTVEITVGTYFPEVMPGSNTDSYVSIYDGVPPANDQFGVDFTGLRRGNLTSGVNIFTGLFTIGTNFIMRIWVATATASYTKAYSFVSGSQGAS